MVSTDKLRVSVAPGAVKICRCMMSLPPLEKPFVEKKRFWDYYLHNRPSATAEELDRWKVKEQTV